MSLACCSLARNKCEADSDTNSMSVCGVPFVLLLLLLLLLLLPLLLLLEPPACPLWPLPLLLLELPLPPVPSVRLLGGPDEVRLKSKPLSCCDGCARGLDTQ